MSHLDKAIELFNVGFTSKASQKRALGYLNSCYDVQTNQIREKLIAKKSLRDLSHEFSEQVEVIVRIVELRQAIKDAEINKPEPKTDAKKEAVLTSIKEMLEKRKASYLRGVDLAEMFNGLQVSVSAHYVTNEQGTTFIRHFFYLFGKLTALNTIIAVAEKHNEKGV